MALTDEAVADVLLSTGAVSINTKEPYRYSSGILSPVYTDHRILMSFPKERRKIIDWWTDMIYKLGEWDLIAGTATAGIPHAAWISEKMDLPMVYVRGEAKAHGKKSQIEGVAKPGQRAIIIEDLISTAGSSLVTQKALSDAGVICKNIAAIFTYTLKSAEENLANAKVQLDTLTTFPVVVEKALAKKVLNSHEKDIVLDWIGDAVNWGKKHGFE